MATQLNHERVKPSRLGGFASSSCATGHCLGGAKTHDRRRGRRCSTSPGSRPTWPGAEAELDAMFLLNWRMAHGGGGREAQSGRLVVGQDLRGRAGPSRSTAGCSASSGAGSYVGAPGRQGAALAGRIERTARHAQINTFGGGRERDPTRDRGHGRPGNDAERPGERQTDPPPPPPPPPPPRLPGPAGGLQRAFGRRPDGGTGRGQPGHDPSLGRGHGRREPGVHRREGGPGQRFRRGHRSGHHAPGLDHAGLQGHGRNWPPPGPLGRTPLGSNPADELMHVLDKGGFTSVVATNCEQEYHRPVVLGDRLRVSSSIESVSTEKHTALGIGHFLTTLLSFTDQRGDRWPQCVSGSSVPPGDGEDRRRP